MNQDFIRTIIKSKKKCLFISPHPDDVLLSCGTLLSKLAGHTDTVVVNVFTKAHLGPYTLSARKFLQICNEQNAVLLADKRVKEDKIALSKIPVKILNLGLQDALFRQKHKAGFIGALLPELNHVYATYRWHIVRKISPHDPAISQLVTLLKPLIKKDTIVFAPFGIGNHVDHQITRKVCEKLTANIILYSDFPYNIRENFYGEPEDKQILVTLSPNGLKNKLIKLYSSQFRGLFPDGKIPNHKEVYFIPNLKKNIAK